jgi:hypothetical protein
VVHVQVGGVPLVHPVAFWPHEFPLPWQLPLLSQVSVIVHALPSSHAGLFVFGDLAQAPAEHTPTLHWSLYAGPEQSIGEPLQTPFAHVSPVVHALPSSQVAVLSTFLHPSDVSQLSSVHGLPSSQLTAVPPTH